MSASIATGSPREDVRASATALIGIDWGTTSARAYRIADDGSVLDTRAAALGILNVRDRAFAGALDTLLGDWRDLAVPRLACGMIGSRQGWHEVAYCPTPGTLAALAAGIATLPDGSLAIVPGLQTRDARGLPDVMRGEETQIVGAADAAASLAWVVLPGTHSKWARVEQGSIVAFTTYMTGELYAALLDHTILGRLAVRNGGAFDQDAFGRGVRRALEGGALTHDLFGARTLALLGELDQTAVADWLSGLLIGAEMHAVRREAAEVARVEVVGDPALARRYAIACRHAGLAATTAPPHAAARGLWRLAVAAGLAPVGKRA